LSTDSTTYPQLFPQDLVEPTSICYKMLWFVKQKMNTRADFFPFLLQVVIPAPSFRSIEAQADRIEA
ncbi:MAG: hypothetical protein ACREKF_06950, partial [Candidatus Methylomirabilales bacterium]